jgi:hypothetical protein
MLIRMWIDNITVSDINSIYLYQQGRESPVAARCLAVEDGKGFSGVPRIDGAGYDMPLRSKANESASDNDECRGQSYVVGGNV